MENNNNSQAEVLLEQIFYYMNQLVYERDFNKTLVLLTDMGRSLVEAERASFWYWDTEKKQYWTLMASDSEQLVIPEGTGIVGATISTGETIVINNPYDDERFNSSVDAETGFVTKSILCMPVINRAGDVIGAYQAINKMGRQGESQFDETDVKRLTLAAAYSGKVLESHLLYQAAHVDNLTRLRNRRGFYEYYNIEIVPVLEKQEVTLIICDIDYFKKVNDTYGHNAGDAVLVMVAQALKEHLENGEVFRWGGEEFILLIPDCSIDRATEIAETIRQSIEQKVYEYEEENIRITMSFGVQTLQKGVTVETNIEKADAKLYEAKASGRNRVIR